MNSLSANSWLKRRAARHVLLAAAAVVLATMALAPANASSLFPSDPASKQGQGADGSGAPASAGFTSRGTRPFLLNGFLTYDQPGSDFVYFYKVNASGRSRWDGGGGERQDGTSADLGGDAPDATFYNLFGFHRVPKPAGGFGEDDLPEDPGFGGGAAGSGAGLAATGATGASTPGAGRDRARLRRAGVGDPAHVQRIGIVAEHNWRRVSGVAGGAGRRPAGTSAFAGAVHPGPARPHGARPGRAPPSCLAPPLRRRSMPSSIHICS